VTRSAGFTLLETMVALALTGVIAVSLGSALRFVSRADRAVRDSHVLVEDIRLLSHWLAERLARARPRDPLAAPGAAAFVGDAKEMSFIAPGRAPDGAEVLCRYRLAVEAGAKGERLLIRVEEHVVPEESEAAVRRATAAATWFTGVEFAYLAGADPHSGWQSRWEDATALPRLVRVRLRTRGQRALPEIVIRPRLAAAGGL